MCSFNIFLSHILVILTILETFPNYYNSYSEVCYYGHCFANYEQYPSTTANLIISIVCVLTTWPYSTNLYLTSFPSGLPIPWDSTILISDQLMTVQWPVGIQVEGRVTLFSFWVRSYKLFSLGSKACWKLRWLKSLVVCQLAKLQMQRESSWKKWQVFLWWTHEWKEGKRAYCWYCEVARRVIQPQHSLKPKNAENGLNFSSVL